MEKINEEGANLPDFNDLDNLPWGWPKPVDYFLPLRDANTAVKDYFPYNDSFYDDIVDALSPVNVNRFNVIFFKKAKSVSVEASLNYAYPPYNDFPYWFFVSFVVELQVEGVSVRFFYLEMTAVTHESNFLFSEKINLGAKTFRKLIKRKLRKWDYQKLTLVRRVRSYDIDFIPFKNRYYGSINNLQGTGVLKGRPDKDDPYDLVELLSKVFWRVKVTIPILKALKHIGRNSPYIRGRLGKFFFPLTKIRLTLAVQVRKITSHRRARMLKKLAFSRRRILRSTKIRVIEELRKFFVNKSAYTMPIVTFFRTKRRFKKSYLNNRSALLRDQLVTHLAGHVPGILRSLDVPWICDVVYDLDDLDENEGPLIEWSGKCFDEHLFYRFDLNI